MSSFGVLHNKFKSIIILLYELYINRKGLILIRIIFIRHGEPDYEHDTLTEKGWREAHLLAQRVCQWDIKDFYCSPLGRARDTASPALKLMRRDAEIQDWLREFPASIEDPTTGNRRCPWDFAPEFWTEQPALYDHKLWYETPVMKTGPVEETYRYVTDSLDALLAEYGYDRYHNYYKVRQHNDDTIVFFCHFGITCVMLSHLLGISPVLLWQGFFLPPTSVTILATEEIHTGNAGFRVQMLGDTTHLHDGKEPISASGYFGELMQEIQIK